MNHNIKRFGEHWTFQNKLLTYLYLAFFYLRGCLKRLFIGSVKGRLFVGKNVRILYPKNLSVGTDTIIEDGVEINCLAKDGIKFGNRVTIGKNAIIRPSNIYGGPIGDGLEIGNNSNIGPFNYIGCSGKITIGNNVMMSPGVSIYAENHNFSSSTLPMKEQGVTVQFVNIQDDCWLASNCIILAGVTVGKGSVVAAGAVVTKDVAPYSVVAGSPAVVIKSRN
jgi:acetyltransferase-like isoleucine patch superfamily enzyme